jgi:acyl-coenzyme A thioesterase PaaI-like protein
VGNVGGVTDFEAIRESMPRLVPFVKTLGLEYLELSEGRAVLRLADQAAFHNHVGGPHAGAIFTLAESASGAVVIGSFEDLLGRVTPLAASAEIAYTKLQKGPVTAEALLGRPAAEVRRELDETGRTVQFPVTVQMRDEAGDDTSHMTISWALRPHR